MGSTVESSNRGEHQGRSGILSSLKHRAFGIHIRTGNVIWVNGPFPAGDTDLVIFRKDGGLKQRIPPGKKVIADKIYKAVAVVSTENRLDVQATSTGSPRDIQRPHGRSIRRKSQTRYGSKGCVRNARRIQAIQKEQLHEQLSNDEGGLSG